MVITHPEVEAALRADKETVLQFVRDIPSTKPVHDYITDLDERCALFGELQQLHEALGAQQLNAAIFAFLMVAPISRIREHLESVRNTDPTHALEVLDLAALRAPDAMKAYIPKGRSSTPPTEMLGNQGNVSRNKRAALKAKERDNSRCILSGMADPAAAHLFPFATTKNKQFSSLNGLLKCFWGEDKAQAWRKLYEDPAITESPANYLSLNHQLRFWFDEARLAFKPISQTDTTITLQFHWLRKTNLLPTTLAFDRGEMFLDQAGLRTSLTEWGSHLLAHRESGMPIRTGQLYHICARSPAELPSFELLELQWHLLRVAAICGAADVEDETDSDMDDDWQPCLAASPSELPIAEGTLPIRTAGAGESSNG